MPYLMKELRAVAFDVDGTLYPYTRLILKAFLFGVTNPRVGPAFARVRRRIRYIRPIDDFRLMQAKMLAESTGLTSEQAAAWIEKKIYTEWLRTFRSVRPHPHVREAMLAVRERGLQCAVMSDFPVEEKLAYLGLAGLPDVAICSEESCYLKPNPEPFRLLARLLDLAPEEVLYVGDHYEYDVMGAHAVGMKVAHMTRRPRQGSVADFQFAGYKELIRSVRDGLL